MKKLLIAFFLACVGCGGFNQSNRSAFGGSEGNQSANMILNLVVRTGPLEGTVVVDQVRNSKVRFLVPMRPATNIPLVPQFALAPAGLAGQIFSDSLGQRTVLLDIPLGLVSQGVSGEIATTLPNGEPLSFLDSGQARHLSFLIDQSNSTRIHVYWVPPRWVGVFVQSDFDFGLANAGDVVPGDSLTSVGFASTHTHRPPLNGGRFVFISLPQ
jgi:hypothetical protein